MFEWKARIQLLLGQERCLNNAMATVKAPFESVCGGTAGASEIVRNMDWEHYD